MEWEEEEQRVIELSALPLAPDATLGTYPASSGPQWGGDEPVNPPCLPEQESIHEPQESFESAGRRL